MNVIDRFLKQYSYRFPKGYPNLTDPSDKKLMQEILSELELDLKHRPITEETELYDKTIQSALNVEAVPAVQGKYSLGANISFSCKVMSASSAA